MATPTPPCVIVSVESQSQPPTSIANSPSSDFQHSNTSSSSSDDSGVLTPPMPHLEKCTPTPTRPQSVLSTTSSTHTIFRQPPYQDNGTSGASKARASMNPLTTREFNRQQREQEVKAINEGFKCLREIISMSSDMEELRTVLIEAEKMVSILQSIQRERFRQ